MLKILVTLTPEGVSVQSTEKDSMVVIKALSSAIISISDALEGFEEEKPKIEVVSGSAARAIEEASKLAKLREKR